MMNVPESEKLPPRVRVNGAMLGNHIGKGVILMAATERSMPNDVVVEVKTSDNQLITVQLNKPLAERLTGFVEFHGTATGKNAMKADYYATFSSDCTKGFNVEQYNKTVTLINNIPNDWAM